MKKLFKKDDIEKVVLQAVMSYPYKEINGYKIYSIKKDGEEVVITNIKGNKTVETLTELEEAINDPKVKHVFIPKFATITSKGLGNVLKRTSLTKEIFCAFDVEE